jgi:hypothetical protein
MLRAERKKTGQSDLTLRCPWATLATMRETSGGPQNGRASGRGIGWSYRAPEIADCKGDIHSRSLHLVPNLSLEADHSPIKAAHNQRTAIVKHNFIRAMPKRGSLR